jgi:uncharacterized cupin superfamily protein
VNSRHSVPAGELALKSFCTWLIASTAMTGGLTWADAPPKPVKVTAAQAAGPVFDRKDAVKENGADGPTTDVTILHSADRKFSAGIFKAGPSDTMVESYPEDEFCYFLSGSVKLTSADGTVLVLKAGEAMALPKGWKGRWTTKGYTKYYVVYDTVPEKK